MKDLLDKPLLELLAEANKLPKLKFELCGIVNAKSGLCTEDCKFCAQSAKHSADVSTYPLLKKSELISAAKQAKSNGAAKFGVVTSGNTLNQAELEVIADSIKAMKEDVGIEPCASLGALTKEQLLFLKEAGLTRYHHNIETSRNYYPQIVTTHSFAERIETIKVAKEIGLEVCSGGIIGLGESWQDRLDMALLLKKLNVDSVPLNILVPIKGTAMEHAQPISGMDAVKAIAIFRIILKDKTIKIAAGRETVFKDYQAMGFLAGANGMLIGGYLTVKGRSVEEDQKLVAEVKKLWQQ